jgi:hypothetical protein
MLNKTTIDSSLIASYQSANYIVRAPQPFTLNIGVASQPLKSIYLKAHIKSAGFITAYNPHSHALTDQENVLRNAKLIAEIQQRSLKFIAGVGQCPESEWPGEESVLVLGISLEAAKALGKQYGQNAIVWCDADALPQLIFLI